jgi:hypothetical protein
MTNQHHSTNNMYVIDVIHDIVRTYQCSGGSRGGSQGAMEPPFGLHQALRSTDDKQNGTTSLATELRKVAAMAHLTVL